MTGACRRAGLNFYSVKFPHFFFLKFLGQGGVLGGGGEGGGWPNFFYKK